VGFYGYFGIKPAWKVLEACGGLKNYCYERDGGMFILFMLLPSKFVMLLYWP
jgi:hypothetical protein